MAYANLASGIFWLIIGFLLSIWSMSYEIGSFKEPDSGFLPLGVGLLLIVFSLILIVQSKKSSSLSQTGSPLFLPGRWKKVAYTISVLLFCTFLFERIGYLATIFLLIFLSGRGTGLQSWRKAFLFALLSTIGVYVIFVLLLKQPLPRSPWEI